MANKTEEQSLDDFDFDDLSFDEVEFGEPGSVKNDRNAVTRVASDMLTGAKSKLVDPDHIKNLSKRALPKGYGIAIDSIDSLDRGVSELYDAAAKELKPAKPALQRITAKTLPKMEKFLPSSIKEKLEDFVNDKGYSSPSQGQLDEDAIKNSVGEIFKQQFAADAEMRRHERTEDELNQRVQQKQLENQTDVLRGIYDSTNKLASYQDQVTLKYQQKSLELQYRSYFALRDTLKIQEAAAKDTKTQLEAIVKNTGLPEMVKIGKMERASEMLRDRFLGKMGETAHEFSKNMWGKVQKKLIDRVKEASSGIASAIEQAESMGESGLTPQLMMQMVIQNIGGWAAGRVTSYSAKKLRPILEKRFPELKQQGDRLEYLLSNPQELFRFVQNYRPENNHSFTHEMRDQLLEMLREFLPKFKLSDKLENKGLDSLDDPMHFDRYTHRTINEIIPGYLSRIHLELQGIRTGKTFDDKERLVFDHDKRKFTSFNDRISSLKERVNPSSNIFLTNEAADRLIADIGLNPVEHPKIVKELRAQLIEDSRAGLLPGFNPDLWGSKAKREMRHVSNETRELVGQLVDRVFLRQVDGRTDTDWTRLRAHNKYAKRLEGAIFNNAASVQGLLDLGMTEELEDMGYMTRDGKFKTDWKYINADIAGVEASEDAKAKILKERRKIKEKKEKRKERREYILGSVDKYVKDTPLESMFGFFKDVFFGELDDPKAIVDLKDLVEDFTEYFGEDLAKRVGEHESMREAAKDLRNSGKIVNYNSTGRSSLLSTIPFSRKVDDDTSYVSDTVTETLSTAAILDRANEIAEVEGIEVDDRIVDRATEELVNEVKESTRRTNVPTSRIEKLVKKHTKRARTQAKKAVKVKKKQARQWFQTKKAEFLPKIKSTPAQLQSHWDRRDAYLEKAKTEWENRDAHIESAKTAIADKAKQYGLEQKWQSAKSTGQSWFKSAEAAFQTHVSPILKQAGAKIEEYRKVAREGVDEALQTAKETVKQHKGFTGTIENTDTFTDLRTLAVERNELLKELVESLKTTTMVVAEASGGKVNPDSLMGRLRNWASSGWTSTRGVKDKLWGATKHLGTKAAMLPIQYLKGTYGLLWGGIKGAASTVKSAVDWAKAPSDVYSNRTGKVLLYAKKMIAGEYFDAKTRKPIHSIRDIAGEVIDSQGNVVMSQEEYETEAYDTRMTKLWKGAKSAISGFGRYTGAVFGLYGNLLTLPFRVANWGFRKLREAHNEKEPKDVYVVGDDPWVPRLRGVLIKAGRYRNKKSGRVLTSHLDVKDGEVIDEMNRIVISFDDIDRGIVDYKGKPFKGLTRKILDGVKWLGGWGVKAAKGYADLVWGAVGALKDVGLGLLGIPGSLRGKRDDAYWKSHSERLFDVIVSIHDLLDARLPNTEKEPIVGSWRDRVRKRKEKEATAAKAKEESKTGTAGVMSRLMTWFQDKKNGFFRFLDSDGDGQTDAEEAAEAAQEAADDDGGGGGMYVLGGDGKDGKNGKDAKNQKATRGGRRGRGRFGRGRGFGAGASVASTATQTASKGGLFSRGARFLTNPKTAIAAMLAGSFMPKEVQGAVDTALTAHTLWSLGGMAKGALGLGGASTAATAATGATAATTGAAGTAGSVAAGTGATVAGAAALPLLLGAAAIGGGAYMAYRSFRYGGNHPLRDYRMAQYNVNPDEKSQVEAILKLENHILEKNAVKRKGDQWAIEGTLLDGNYVLELFDQDPDWFDMWGGANTKTRSQFYEWLDKRFAPVFTAHYATLMDHHLDSFEAIAEKLKPEDQLRYLEDVHKSVPRRVYDTILFPFHDSEYGISTPTVEKAYEKAKHEIQLRLQGKKTSRFGQTLSSIVMFNPGTQGAKWALEATGLASIARNSDFLQNTYRKLPAWAQDLQRGLGLMRDEKGSDAKVVSERLESLKDKARKPSNLDMVRIRAYGIKDFDKARINAVLSLEAMVIGEINTVDGVAKYERPLDHFWAEASKSFELVESNDSDKDRWEEWFEKRFLPVVLTFVNGVKAEKAGADPLKADKDLTAEQLVKVAKLVVGAKYKRLIFADIPVWRSIISPWSSEETLEMNPNSADEFIRSLEQGKSGSAAQQYPTPALSENRTTPTAMANQVQQEAKAIVKQNQASSLLKANAFSGTASFQAGNGSLLMMGGAGATTAASTAYAASANGEGVAVVDPNRVGSGNGGNYSSLPNVSPTTSANATANRRVMEPLIRAAAAVVGMEPEVLLRIVQRESSFQSNAAAKSSTAKGLFQFTGDTWSGMMAKYGDRFGIPRGTPPTDPRANALLGAQFVLDNYRYIRNVKGSVPVTDSDLYAAHFLGPAGFKKLYQAGMSAPITSAVSPGALRANRSVFYPQNGQPMRTTADFWRWVDGKMRSSGGSVPVTQLPTSATADSGGTTVDMSKDASVGFQNVPAWMAYQADPSATSKTVSNLQSSQPNWVMKSGDSANTTVQAPPTDEATPPIMGGDLMDPSQGENWWRPFKSDVRLNGMAPAFKSLLLGAFAEYGEKTGKKVTVTSGFRSYAEQARLKAQKGAGAARPGSSPHEFGFAVDINSPDADAMDRLGILKKYGLTRPIGKEPWHIEPIGVQGRINEAKQAFTSNPGALAGMIQAGIGRGGGGYGALGRNGMRSYSRGGTDIIPWNGQPGSSAPPVTTAQRNSPTGGLPVPTERVNVMTPKPIPSTGMLAGQPSTTGTSIPNTPFQLPTFSDVIPKVTAPPMQPVNLPNPSTVVNVGSTDTASIEQANLVVRNERREANRVGSEMAVVTETLNAQLEVQREILDIMREFKGLKDRETAPGPTTPILPVTHSANVESKEKSSAPRRMPNLGEFEKPRGVLEIGVGFARNKYA